MSDAGAHLMAMTTARGTDMAAVGRGGYGQLTRADVAGAMGWGHLPEGAYLLALAKYTDDWMGMDKLEHLVWQYAVDSAAQAGVTAKQLPVGKELLRNHARLALSEVIGSNRCLQCAGTGSFNRHECFACSGTGEFRLTERTIAGALGIPKTSWRRNWKPHYDRLLADLECWSDWALNHVYKYSR